MPIHSIPLLFAALFLLHACAPVSVTTIKSDEFARYDIPRRLTLVGSDGSPETRNAVAALGQNLANAGFTVESSAAVEKTVRRRGHNFRSLLDTPDLSTLRCDTGLDAVVFVRYLYGTEVRMIRLKDGETVAGGCWRTPMITVANEVVKQLKEGKVVPRLCPVKTGP